MVFYVHSKYLQISMKDALQKSQPLVNSLESKSSSTTPLPDSPSVYFILRLTNEVK